MGCSCAPSLVALRKEVDRLFLRRDRASDGCCGDAAHAARRSDHNPTGGYAHALDIDEDVAPGLDLWWLVPVLLADRRTKYVIYEATIWYRACSTHGVGRCPGHRYAGVNAHKHHLHLSVVASATHDVGRWLPAGVVPTIEEDPLASFTFEQLVAAARDGALAAIRGEGVSGAADAGASTVDDGLDAQVKAMRRDLRRLGEALGVKVES
ncbi:MAG TPA: hypothetical protein VFU14_20215 [Acidimicrobiales bacterium]|nr:hypothetical protein [Acidimicrobiales bacterium]